MWGSTHLQSRYLHSEIQFLRLFVSFVLLPLTFFILYYSSKRECHFSFPRRQHHSALLSDTSAIISLSYYGSNGGPFIQSVTFRETSDIHGGTAVLVHWCVSAQQNAGCRGGGSTETSASWRAGWAFELPESVTSQPWIWICSLRALK